MARRGWNEGSISKRSNGTWRAQILFGGKRINFRAKTRTECQQWLRKTLDQKDQGIGFEGRNIPLGTFLQDWISTKGIELKPKTKLQYESLIEKYIIPTIGNKKLFDLNLLLINRFYSSLIKRNVGTRTIRYIHSVLHVALEQAVRNGFLIRNPAHGATLPRKEHKEMQVLNEDQVNQFLIAVKDSRLKTLYHLALSTGMRQGELLGLKWSDIDWNHSTLQIKRQLQYIVGKGLVFSDLKTHFSLRAIKLGSNMLNELRAHRRRQEVEINRVGKKWKDNSLIFPSSVGTPTNPSNLVWGFKKLLKMAGLPSIRFHDLRHTAATLMISHGVPVNVVSKILGHSKVSVTLNIYAHSNTDMQEQAAKIMDDLTTPIAFEVEKPNEFLQKSTQIQKNCTKLHQTSSFEKDQKINTPIYGCQ